MKTPRELLLNRRQAITPKLDAIRREVVNTELRATETSLLDWPVLLWRELVWPCRRIWAGLSAVWLVILVVNVSMRDNSQTTLAKSSPTPATMMTFQQQERLLAELIEPRETRAAEPRKKSIPQPRSERHDEISRE